MKNSISCRLSSSLWRPVSGLVTESGFQRRSVSCLHWQHGRRSSAKTLLFRRPTSNLRTVRAMSTDSSSSSPLSSLQGKPVAKLVPPGQCQFGKEFQSVTLLDRVQVCQTSSILRFSLPNVNKPLNLSTCACILAGAKIHGEQVVRPYTPISTNALEGCMDLLIKNYGSKGTMSTFLHSLEVGSSQVSFKHIEPNVKIQAPDLVRRPNVIMLAGGTGITPMIQALHAILDDKNIIIDHNIRPKVTLLYGSQHSHDVLAQSLLEDWAKEYSDRFQVVSVMSEEPEDSSWKGRRGVIDASLLQEYLRIEEQEDTLILVCGPPPMYQALCGPRHEPDQVKGILGKMGYTEDQVYKF